MINRVLTVLLGAGTDAVVVAVEDNAHLLHELNLLIVVRGQVDIGNDGFEGGSGRDDNVGLAHCVICCCGGIRGEGWCEYAADVKEWRGGMRRMREEWGGRKSECPNRRRRVQRQQRVALRTSTEKKNQTAIRPLGDYTHVRTSYVQKMSGQDGWGQSHRSAHVAASSSSGVFSWTERAGRQTTIRSDAIRDREEHCRVRLEAKHKGLRKSLTWKEANGLFLPPHFLPLFKLAYLQILSSCCCSSGHSRHGSLQYHFCLNREKITIKRQ